jgi:hypothetical protein
LQDAAGFDGEGDESPASVYATGIITTYHVSTTHGDLIACGMLDEFPAEFMHNLVSEVCGYRAGL